MVVEQGDVVWVELPPPQGSAPAGRRPAIVLQHDRYNRSRLNTIVVVAITSNRRYAPIPGNVRLSKGEAGLDRPSVVNATQIATVDRAQLRGKIGHLTTKRLLEVWDGSLQVLRPAALDLTAG